MTMRTRLFVVLMLVGGVHGARADKLSDFKDAASRTSGCSIIPATYELRKQCEDAQIKVANLCGQKFACDQALDKSNRTEIQNRIANGQACLDARKDVQYIYQKTKGWLAAEQDPDIKPLAEQIIRAIAAGEENHQKAIDDTKQAILNCNQLLGS